jgi:hypothetical protein
MFSNQEVGGGSPQTITEIWPALQDCHTNKNQLQDERPQGEHISVCALEVIELPWRFGPGLQPEGGKASWGTRGDLQIPSLAHIAGLELVLSAASFKAWAAASDNWCQRGDLDPCSD